MQMDNGTKSKLFDKIDGLKDEVHEIAKGMIEVRETQKRHYELNESDHNNLTGEIAEIKECMDKMDDKIDTLEAGHHAQETVIQRRVGERKVFGSIFQLVLAVIGSGAVLGGLAWFVKSFLIK